MEIRELQMFLALAEELHFGRAAARLHISQPPLTKHIQQLEERLGVTLFDRNKRSVRLTPAGSALVIEARRMVNQSEAAVQAVRRAGRGETGRLRVGFVAAVIYMNVERVLQRIDRDLPGVESTWEEMGSSEQIEALRQDRIDLGFAQVPQGKEEMNTHLVASVPLVVALPESHRLARQRRINLHDLEDEPFIVIPRESAPGFFDLIVTTCFSAGFSPNIRHYAKHLLSVVSLVALGRGFALVPATLSKASLPGVVLKPLAGIHAEAQYSVIWNPQNKSPVLARALKVLGVTEGN